MTTLIAILTRHYICIKDSTQIVLEFKWIQCIHILTIKNRRKQSAAGSVVIISGLIWCVCSVYQWITQKNRRKYTAEEIAEKFVLQLMSCRNWMENVTNWNVTDGCFSCFFRTLSVWALSNNSNVIYFNLSAPWEHFPHVTTRSLRLHLLFRHCTKYHAKLICGHTHTQTHTGTCTNIFIGAYWAWLRLLIELSKNVFPHTFFCRLQGWSRKRRWQVVQQIKRSESGLV